MKTKNGMALAKQDETCGGIIEAATHIDPQEMFEQQAVSGDAAKSEQQSA